MRSPTVPSTTPPSGAESAWTEPMASGPVRLPLVNGSFDGLRRPHGAPAGALRDADVWKPSDAKAPLLQVGDLARACGKTVRAIHHYEELGLLRPDARSKGRFRLYDEGAVTRIRWIGKLHDLGMSLAEIRNMVSSWETAPNQAQAMREVRELYRARLSETRLQIEHLKRLESELEASIDYLGTCSSCERDSSAIDEESQAPAVVLESQGCVACELREREIEPDLVAGIVVSTP